MRSLSEKPWIHLWSRLLEWKPDHRSVFARELRTTVEEDPVYIVAGYGHKMCEGLPSIG